LTPPAAPPRALLRVLAGAATLFAVAAPAQAKEPETANFDARPPGAAAVQAQGERGRDALRERLGRFAAVSLDDHTGTLRSVGRLDGFLTGPSGRDGTAIALGYVRDHAAAFGLDGDDIDSLQLVDREFVNGVEHLAWEQRYRGIPVADAGLQAAVTGSGRLLTVTGPPAADPAVRSTAPSVTAAAAYAAARASGGDPSPAAAVTGRGGGAEQLTRFGDGGRASLTLYHAGAGYRLAWRVLAPVSSTGVYDVLVDARSAQPVRRANRVKFAVPADVFEYNPAVADTVPVDLEPWLSSTSSLSGPNAHAFADVHDAVGPQENGGYQLAPEAGSDIARQPGGGYEFELNPVDTYGAFPNSDGCPGEATTFPSSICTWDAPNRPGSPQPHPGVAFSWEVNKEQSATQLFYLVNTFHDHLRDDPGIAFDGFRVNPGKPLGNPNTGSPADSSDPVLAQALDGADTDSGLPDDEHVNNANFLTLPDGYPGMMQMYLWKLPFGGYDGANDAATVFHEYTHGLTDRLVTDAAGFGALWSAQAGAMSEGLSDFYALDYLAEQGLQPDAAGTADVRFGRYLDNASGTIDATVQELVRIQSIDCVSSSPSPNTACRAAAGAAGPGAFTYADFGKIDADGVEFHADGEIWAQTIWSLRAALIAEHGEVPGIARARRYITTALRLSPPEPSFLDMRNAILQASTDEDDDALMWTVFADREMGYFASTDGSGDIAPVADDTNPATLTGSTTVSGTVIDTEAVPVEGAEVAIAGLGDEVVDQTDGSGGYELEVPVPAAGNHTYPAVRARKPMHAEDVEPDVELVDGVPRTIDFELERDWSSVLGGASVEQLIGTDHSDDGCGPGGLIDDDPGVVWGGDNASGQRIVVDLGAPVDIARIAIDPAAGCGDDPSASLGEYELSGATGPDGPFTALSASGTFTPGDNGTLTTAFSGPAPRVRFVALHPLSPQDESPGGSGADYIDVAELHVAKTPFSAIGPTVETGGSHSVGISTATMTGTVTPRDGGAEVVFEYGPTIAYGATTPAATLGAGGPETPVAATVGGLAPSTTYHFRAVARGGGDDYPGADRTFTTAPAPPPPPPPLPTPTPTPTPSATPTPTPTPDPGPPVTATRFDVTKLSASRKGLFKVRVRFGSGAPAGTARLTVLAGKKRIAKGKLAVRAGRAATKTLRLTSKGRRLIKPGKSRKVTLELRLPGGEKLKKSIRLTRKKR
jgi:extracellular elastinolytic metalloproteinase